jgi:neurotransmitter:Na+ symporter, NSS family
MPEKEQSLFSSKLGFIIASIAMAVGTGNIWRFPRVAASNGGGAFVIVLLISLVVTMIPLLMSEMIIGRYGRKGTVGSYADFMGGRQFSWVGAWMGFVCVAIMFYYSVVCGWTLKYVVLAVSGQFKAGADTAAIWTAFTTNPAETIFYHFAAMAVSLFIIYQGVAKGIERYTKIFLPGLAVLLVVAAIRALTLPGAWKGVEFLFHINAADLVNPTVWLQAFTQGAWSSGAGWALLMTYAIYSRPRDDVGASMFVVGFADIGIALIAGLAVLPAIFALAPGMGLDTATVLGSGNTGITFIYMAQLFTTMPGGSIIAIAFFLGLAFAGVSSLLSMIEVGVSNLVTAGWERKKAAVYTAVAGFIVGVPSAYSMNFLNNQDWVWGVGLLISGVFTAFAVMKFGVEKARTELINHEGTVFHVGKWYNYCIYASPIIIGIIFVWWFRMSLDWYPQPWNPFLPESTGTMVFQWVIVAAIFILANKWLGSYFNPHGATQLSKKKEAM